MAVSVKDIRELADRIATKADEAERAYQTCTEAYARYEQLQHEVRELTLAFNGLAQQLTATPAPQSKEEPTDGVASSSAQDRRAA